MSDCLFCRIAAGTIPSKIVYQDDQTMAFEDVNPQAPVHVLVIPRRHVKSVGELESTDAVLIGHLILACVRVAQEKGIANSGYRIVTNIGAHGGQTVCHLHFHVLGGRPMTWPPG